MSFIKNFFKKLRKPKRILLLRLLDIAEAADCYHQFANISDYITSLQESSK
jgi:hypothetical protein